MENKKGNVRNQFTSFCDENIDKNKDKKEIKDCVTVSFSKSKEALSIEDIFLEFISLKYIKI